jgi:hypothetical protein
MGGGLLNLVSHGTSSIFLFGNPQKSLFYKTYKSITNFGMQRFRLECDKKQNLNMTTETIYSFKIERHADLLGDTHLVVNIPDIWCFKTEEDLEYNFSWIHELGTSMINEISVESGGVILAKYTGEYLSLIEHRDNATKLDLWKRMIGDVPDMYDSKYQIQTKYPTIRGRKLYIPLKCWFTLASEQALPLVALQYSPVYIHVTIKPIIELYRIRIQTNNDVSNWKKPNLNDPKQKLHYFIQKDHENMIKDLEWNLDIHIIATYYFLDENERKEIAKKDHKYLVKDMFQHKFKYLHGPSVLKLDTRGLVSNFQFLCRRSDVDTRNEWTNFSNYEYLHEEYPPTIENTNNSNYSVDELYRYEEIIQDFKLVMDGNERESTLDTGILQYIEPYTRSNGCGKKYVHYYNFTTNTDLSEYQPHGAMNMDKFEDIHLHVTTIEPPINPESSTSIVCNTEGDIIGIDRKSQEMFEYTYDMDVYEERYNIIMINNGMIGTFFAR